MYGFLAGGWNLLVCARCVKRQVPIEVPRVAPIVGGGVGWGGRRHGPRGVLTKLGGYGGVVGQCSDLSALCVAPANVGIDWQLVSNTEVLFPRTRVTSRSRPRSIGTDMFVAFVKLPPIAKQTVTFGPRVQGLKVVIASLAVFGSIFGCVNSNPRSKRGWASKRSSPEQGSIS